MSFTEVLTERLKNAMKAKDQKTLSVLRMVKTQLQMKTTEAGFSGELTDEIALAVVAEYVKKVNKSIPEFEKAGEQGLVKLEQARFEVDYLSEFLPKRMGEEETRSLVAGAIEELGVTDVRQVGRVMGAIMKSHKDQVDATLVRHVAEELLGSKQA